MSLTLNSSINNRKGILLMLAAMAGFTIEDAFIKQLSSTISIGQILITIGLCSSVFFAIVALTSGHSLLSSNLWTRATLTRMFAEAIAAVAFVTSLSLVPISTVAAVFQITPLTITMGAALFLGERVGWRRWLAVFVGFIGVLLIIRPGFGGFNPSVLWVLVAVLGVAVRDLVTRVIPFNVESSIISFQAFSSIVIAGTIILLVSPQDIAPIADKELVYLGCTIVFSISGYYAIVSAMRVGNASVVASFRYSRLIFSLLVGVFIFNESVDMLTLIGSVIIIGSGLYTYLREHRTLMESRKISEMIL
ncbi:DMT family transporter [Candidatus Njordibacter sp. Uisw_039]|uniref:DMT family transporter n=1 Tax=Candidatus Njordibacter sp. Uisw_039 TaxID=3230972 RepID=UPI003D501045